MPEIGASQIDLLSLGMQYAKDALLTNAQAQALQQQTYQPLLLLRRGLFRESDQLLFLDWGSLF